MSWDCLLWHGLLPGTKDRESGTKFSIKPASGEACLFFRLDDDAVRQCTGWEDKKLCDLLVFVRRSDPPPVILFVEVKGSHVDDAVKQLESGIELIQKRVSKRLWSTAVKRAFAVVHTTPPQRHIKKMQKQMWTHVDVPFRSIKARRDAWGLQELLS